MHLYASHGAAPGLLRLWALVHRDGKQLNGAGVLGEVGPHPVLGEGLEQGRIRVAVEPDDGLAVPGGTRAGGRYGHELDVVAVQVTHSQGQGLHLVDGEGLVHGDRPGGGLEEGVEIRGTRQGAAGEGLARDGTSPALLALDAVEVAVRE